VRDWSVGSLPVEDTDNFGDRAGRRSDRCMRGDLLGFLDGHGALARRREEAEDQYQCETGRGVRSGPRYHGGPSLVTVHMRAERFGDRTVEQVSRAVNHRWQIALFNGSPR
jgi:hypothetical protein